MVIATNRPASIDENLNSLGGPYTGMYLIIYADREIAYKRASELRYC
jgi:hypothetical protein